MKKAVLISALAAIVIVFLGASALIVWGGIHVLSRPAAQTAVQQVSRGNGNHGETAQRQGSSSSAQAENGGNVVRQGTATATERNYRNAGEPVYERETIAGVVLTGTISEEDITVQTEAGKMITVGAGPQWLQSQGFALDSGEQVRLSGYWEDGEFKAAEITRLSDGARIVLRDASGRPAWSGSGRRAEGQTVSSSSSAERRGRNQR